MKITKRDLKKLNEAFKSWIKLTEDEEDYDEELLGWDRAEQFDDFLLDLSIEYDYDQDESDDDFADFIYSDKSPYNPNKNLWIPMLSYDDLQSQVENIDYDFSNLDLDLRSFKLKKEYKGYWFLPRFINTENKDINYLKAKAKQEWNKNLAKIDKAIEEFTQKF
jgi:hypothetical protein